MKMLYILRTICLLHYQIEIFAATEITLVINYNLKSAKNMDYGKKRENITFCSKRV